MVPLGMVKTCVVFHSLEISPSLMEMLKSLVTDVMLSAVALSIRTEITSCLLALLQSRLLVSNLLVIRACHWLRHL